MDHLVMLYLLALAVLAILLLSLSFLHAVYRTHAPKSTSKSSPRQNPCSLVVFLGSGGHTGEMLRLTATLDRTRYSPRLYLISSDDNLSLAKVSEFEKTKSGNPSQWSVTEIPRARRVYQSFFTAPFTTLQSFAVCLAAITLPLLSSRSKSADLILLNGPGSCVPIALAAFLPRILGMHSPQIIYIESMARVRKLSLSGKILRLFVDRFFVQWEALADGKVGSQRWYLAKKEYSGILV